MGRKRLLITLTMLVATVILAAGAAKAQTPLPGGDIDQFVDPLPILDVTGVSNGTIQTVIAGTGQMEVVMKEFRSDMLPHTFLPGTYDGTWVWGYVTAGTDTSVTRDTYTGPVVVATRGIPSEFKFVNDLGSASTTSVLAYKNSTDQSLHWANPGMVDRYVFDDVDSLWIGNPDHYAGAIPAAVHLHGAEDPAAVDGGPESWFTSSGQHGKAFYSMDGNTNGNYAIYRYPNVQEAAPLWFHDHTLGATRLNVYAGLAGAYVLVDPKLKLPAGLGPIGLSRTSGANVADDTVIPLVVQDRQFDTDGQLYFPNEGINPEHMYWIPEFFGDTVAVNGKVWPYLDVKAQRYRFLLINGSNARTYELTFQGNTSAPVIWQIGTDQGYLDNPVAVDPLVIMPGERAEFIIDFGGLSEGDELVLNNIGPDEPFDGEVGSQDPADSDTTGKVMKFIVVTGAAETDTSFNPADSNAQIRKTSQAIVRLVDPATGTLPSNVRPDLTRELTLVEIANDTERTVQSIIYEGGPLEVLVNNTKWSGLRPDESNPNLMKSPPLDPVNGGTADGIGNWLTEMPREGTTEVWEIVNMTADAHPIHTHLAQFQLLNRQSYDAGDIGIDGTFADDYAKAFPGGDFIPAYGPPLAYGPSAQSGYKYGGNPDVTPYLNGPVIPPYPNEAGWKDTVLVPPGMVTRFVVRWAPTDIPVMPSLSAALRYDFVPNDIIPGSEGAIFDYVWHCHIIDHEDNEMMRPDAVVANPLIPKSARKYQMGRDY